jgi:uncharacterized membrane protein
MNKKWIESLWFEYGGRIVGTFLGFIFGIVYLLAGFWKMLFFVLLISLGFYLGQQLDLKGDLKEKIYTIFFDKWIQK